MPYFYSLTMRDADANKANVVVPFNESGMALADIVEGGQLLVGLVDPITGCVIESVGLSLAIAMPGAGEKTDPVAGSNVQEGANFGFSVTGSDYKYTIRVPGLLESLFTGKAVDTLDVDVAAFVDAMVDGYATTGDVVPPTDKFDNDINGLVSAVKTFRRK